MGEYIDWQPDNSPVKVRVHRRVLAGIEHEGAEEFRGVLLGSASPVGREVLVEDFARLEPGPDFRPIEDWFAGWNRHSLPAVGYFRAGAGDGAQITDNDRELFAKYFPDAMNILLLFQLHGGKAELAPVPGQLHPRRETPAVAPRASESVDRPAAPNPERERPVRMAEAGPLEHIATRERETARPVGEVRPSERTPPREGIPVPLDRLPFREHPRRTVEPEPEPDRPVRMPRRYLAQIAAVGAGFLLGVIGYLAFRGDRPRQNPPAAAPVSEARPAPKNPAPVATARPDTAATTAPVTPASAARPSPFDESSDANRSAEAGSPASRADTQQQVRNVLTRWGDSLMQGDVATHVNLYAPTVSPYFTKSRASRTQIRDDVRQMLGRYGKMTTYNISDISVTPVDANHAFATFRKHWETEDNKFSGEEREQLKLTRKGSDWLIASERELKVYWVRKR